MCLDTGWYQEHWGHRVGGESVGGLQGLAAQMEVSIVQVVRQKAGVQHWQVSEAAGRRVCHESALGCGGTTEDH